MPGIQRILHPTDFSETARPAFQTACALAREYDATLLVLHVMMPSISPLFQGSPPNPMRPFDAQGSARKLPWPQSSDPQVRVEHRLAEGDLAEEILRLIAAVPCDLVVMAAKRKTGLERLFGESVAEEVVRKASCGVLVVNTPRPEPPEAEAAAKPGDPVDVRPLETEIRSAYVRTLVKGKSMEVVRLIVREGQELPQHQSQGEILVHCLEGRVAFAMLGKTETLAAGTLLLLPAGHPHAVKGIENSSLLLTILAPKP